MDDIYLEFGGRDYYICFEELDTFLFVQIKDKKVEEVEERVIFDSKDEETGREIICKKSVNEKEINGVRYEIITNMLEVIFGYQGGEDNDDLLGTKRALQGTSIAYKIAFNTLIKYKIIQEVKN